MIFFYLLVASLPLTQHPLLTKFVGEMTLVKLLGGICLFFALARVTAKGSLPPLLTRGPAPWAFVFCLVGIASHLLRGGPLSFGVTSGFPAFVSALLFLLLAPIMVDTFPRLRRILLIVIGSVAFASVYVLREWQKWHGVFPNFRGWGGVTDDPNYFTLIAVLWLPLAFYLARGAGPLWERVYCWGCCIATLAATVLAASRGGFLGLVAGFLFMVAHTKQRVRNFVLISLVLVPLVLFSPSSPIKRFMEPTYSDEEASENRIIAWKAGLRMFREHPIIGIGLDKFITTVIRYEVDAIRPVWSLAHNNYLQIGVELGLLGFLPFLGILISTYRTLGHVRRHPPTSSTLSVGQVAGAMQAGFVAWVVGVFFISGLQRTFWMFIALTISLACLQARPSPEPVGLSTKSGA
jgi:O-antigen ligase